MNYKKQINVCAEKKGVMTCGDCPDIEICQTVGDIISPTGSGLLGWI